MTFYINLTNGTQLATVDDGTVDTTSSSITLIGKNFPTYGQLLNQNLVSMLENFSNTTSPNSPLVGQIWYDSANNALKYYRTGGAVNYWQNLANISYSSTTPSVSQQNDLWWDTGAQQLKYYDNNQWIVIGPQTTNDGLNRVSGTNSFIVQIGTNNVFQVDAYGRVNAPYNPVMQGTGGAGNGSGVFTGSGLVNPFTWIPTTISLNIGTHYNASTGIFTCPVAGIYEVNATLISLGYSVETTQKIIWWKNQSDTGISARARHLNTNSISIPMTATGYIQCSAFDTLQLVVAADGGGVIDTANSSLSIRLVG